MPNTPEEDLQVENETAEPYRGVMIFRTLQRGRIVYKGGQSKKTYPPQTFYAIADSYTMPGAFHGKKQAKDRKSADETLLVGMDLEAVRALIDQHAPGTGLVVAPTELSSQYSVAHGAGE
jgi:hypothetical protein